MTNWPRKIDENYFFLAFRLVINNLTGDWSPLLSMAQFGCGRLSLVMISFYALLLLFGPCRLFQSFKVPKKATVMTNWPRKIDENYFFLAFRLVINNLTGDWSPLLSMAQFGCGRLSLVMISFYALLLLFGPCRLSEFTLAGPLYGKHTLGIKPYLKWSPTGG